MDIIVGTRKPTDSRADRRFRLPFYRTQRSGAEAFSDDPGARRSIMFGSLLFHFLVVAHFALVVVLARRSGASALPGGPAFASPWVQLAMLVLFLFLHGLVVGPLTAGMLAVSLDQVDRKVFRLGRLFSGFRRFLPSVELFLILIVCPIGAVLAAGASGLFDQPVVVYSLFDNEIRYPSRTVSALFGGLSFVLLIASIGLFHARFAYAPFLIFERSLSAVEALLESARLTRGNTWPSFCLVLLCYVYVFAVSFVCAICALFMVPLAACILAAAYRELQRIDAARQTADSACLSRRLAQLDAVPATDLDSGPGPS